MHVARFGRAVWPCDGEGRLSPGDEQRFRELYDRTYDRLWAFVLRRIPAEDVVADVVSETYLAVWRRMPDVPAAPAESEAWVFSTARKVLSNHRRGTERRVRLFDRIRQRPVDLFVDIPGPENSNQAVMRALEQLRPADREILALAFWDEFDIEQIGHILGCSKNAAAIRLTRARQAFGRAMEAIAPGARAAEVPADGDQASGNQASGNQASGNGGGER
jgi:RNA polymerase sigma-70 factor, ECF subfamily